MTNLYGTRTQNLHRGEMSKDYTLENFSLANPLFYGMVRTKGHIQTILSGSIYDQSGIRPISETRLKNKYVIEVVRVLGHESINASLDYRGLLLITDGVCSTFNEAMQLYETYRKEN